MTLRLLAQPLIAMAYGAISGMSDAKAGRPAYFWALATNRSERRDRVIDGCKDIGRVAVTAFFVDIAYQIVVARHVYPGESVIVALGLALLPYLIARGIVNRIVSAAKRR